jgi:predicted RNase H-like HicB family nuclease
MPSFRLFRGVFLRARPLKKLKNVREAIALHIKSLKKAGDPVPSEPLDSFQTVIEVAA